MQSQRVLVASALLALSSSALAQGFRAAPAHNQLSAAPFFGSSAAAGNFDGNTVFPAPVLNATDYAIGNFNIAPGTAGTVTVFSGQTGAVLNVFTGPVRPVGCGFATDFGASLTSVGDVDGDNQADFLTGAPLSPANPAVCAAGNTGAGFLLRSNGAINLVPNPNTAVGLFGFAVAGIGDWNGDNIGDVAISAGDIVHLFSGATLTTAPAVFATITTSAQVGVVRTLALGPDIDLDGRRELLIGGDTSFCGVVFNFPAPTGPTLQEFDTFSSNTRGIAAAGDMDGNTLPDFAVGDPGASGGAGGIRVFDFVALLGGLPVATLPGGALTTDALGTTLGAGGDVDGDGVAELLAGGGQGSGLVRVISGRTGATLTDTRMTNITGPFSLVNVGDLPLRTDLADLTDGFAETLVASRFDTGATNPPIRAQVLHGGPSASSSIVGGFCGRDQLKIELLDAAGAANVQPVIGTTASVAVRAATGGEVGLLGLGLAAPAGIPFFGCTLFIDIFTLPPIIANTFVTTQANTLTAQTFPANLAALGDASVTPRVPPLSVAFQTLTLDAAGNFSSFSEGLLANLGW